jgi:ADP-ribose pyrophosphatase
MVMKEWEIQASKSLLKIEPWLEVKLETVRLPSGAMIDDFYRIVLPDFTVIAGTTGDGLIITERMYRHGSREVTLSLPSGYLHEGEDPLEGAKRELKEETGYISGTWTSLGKFGVDGNRGCGTAYFFLASRCEKECEPDNVDLEDMEIRTMSLEELMGAISSGVVREMVTVAAIGLVRLELEKRIESRK